MQPGASAYARTAQTALTPRELEAALLLKAATRLQLVKDDWEARRPDLIDALSYNRKLWTVLVSSATDAGNPLPQPVKQNFASLGVFVFKQTVGAMTSPAPERLTSLITINREIAAGLRSQPAA